MPCPGNTNTLRSQRLARHHSRPVRFRPFVKPPSGNRPPAASNSGCGARLKSHGAVTTTGVSRLLDRRASRSRSKLISASPARTLCLPVRAAEALATGPTYRSQHATESRHRCGAAKFTAAWMRAPRSRCHQRCVQRRAVGSIATPSPIIRPANTASGASSSGRSIPAAVTHELVWMDPHLLHQANQSRTTTGHATAGEFQTRSCVPSR